MLYIENGDGYWWWVAWYLNRRLWVGVEFWTVALYNEIENIDRGCIDERTRYTSSTFEEGLVNRLPCMHLPLRLPSLFSTIPTISLSKGTWIGNSRSSMLGLEYNYTLASYALFQSVHFKCNWSFDCEAAGQPQSLGPLYSENSTFAYCSDLNHVQRRLAILFSTKQSNYPFLNFLQSHLLWRWP